MDRQPGLAVICGFAQVAVAVMMAQTKIGGVDRDALLRLWFWFFVWAGIDFYFMPPSQPWRWFAWLAGSGVTCLLLYRHSDLAGIVGYVVALTATAMTLPNAVLMVIQFLAGRFTDWTGAHYSAGIILYVLRQAAIAFVPTVILAMHVASRHRLLRSFEGNVALRRHGKMIPPGAYYFVTFR